LNSAYPLNIFETLLGSTLVGGAGGRMAMSKQGPAISDHTPIFEKHTITYSSAMAMRAV
jgi:hypothetical protein